MALTITHSTPADGTFSATGAAAWDATHSLTVTGTSGQLQYNNGGDLAGMSGTAWNDTTRSLTLTGATVTASAPVFDLSQTWNNAAATFVGLNLNFTNTASAAGSFLTRWQTNSSTQLAVRTDGALALYASGSEQVRVRARAGNAFTLYTPADVAFFDAQLGGVSIWQSGSLGWSSSGSTVVASTDLILTRRGPANLRLGAADAASPQPQTLSVQSVVAGTSNTAGANLTITGSQGTGTGAGGSIIFQVAPAGSSGTAQNALATALTIDGAGRVSIAPVASGSSFSVGGNSSFSSNGTILTLAGNVEINGNGSGIVALQNANGIVRWGGDTILARDAANTLALRNGANAQTFRVYGTTDGTNSSFVSLDMNGTRAALAANRAGSGSFLPLYLGTVGSTAVSIFTSNVFRWSFDNNGHFTANADNTYDIGASGANRPRNVFVAETVSPGRGVTVAGLPTPSTGMMARVTDATAPTVGSTVVGGGAAAALVWYNGANWTVIGV